MRMTRNCNAKYLLWLWAVVGCSSGADESEMPPAECLSQCELAGSCDVRAFEDFPDLADARMAQQVACEGGALWAFEGVCSAGTVVLRTGNGFTSEGLFFDPNTGAFLGLTTTTDVGDPVCQGKSYWPQLVPCTAPTVTVVGCGTSFEVGESGGRGVTQTATDLNPTGLF